MRDHVTINETPNEDWMERGSMVTLLSTPSGASNHIRYEQHMRDTRCAYLSLIIFNLI
jgi:hypothetical protein